MQPQRKRWFLAAVLALLTGPIALASLAPIKSPSTETLFEIPKGTWASRMAGSKADVLPATIHLTLGLNNVLVLKNSDDVPQVFGPALLMPGQTFRLPFDVASTYQFACTAHTSGQMAVIVAPMPTSPWARLRWRVKALASLAS